MCRFRLSSTKKTSCWLASHFQSCFLFVQYTMYRQMKLHKLIGKIITFLRSCIDRLKHQPLQVQIDFLLRIPHVHQFVEIPLSRCLPTSLTDSFILATTAAKKQARNRRGLVTQEHDSGSFSSSSASHSFLFDERKSIRSSAPVRSWWHPKGFDDWCLAFDFRQRQRWRQGSENDITDSGWTHRIGYDAATRFGRDSSTRHSTWWSRKSRATQGQRFVLLRFSYTKINVNEEPMKKNKCDRSLSRKPRRVHRNNRECVSNAASHRSN